MFERKCQNWIGWNVKNRKSGEKLSNNNIHSTSDYKITASLKMEQTQSQQNSIPSKRNYD